jgi:hypothetical protein
LSCSSRATTSGARSSLCDLLDDGSIRILDLAVLNAWVDRYLYEAGLVDTTLPFEELRRGAGSPKRAKRRSTRRISPRGFAPPSLRRDRRGEIHEVPARACVYPVDAMFRFVV